MFFKGNDPREGSCGQISKLESCVLHCLSLLNDVTFYIKIDTERNVKNDVDEREA